MSPSGIVKLSAKAPGLASDAVLRAVVDMSDDAILTCDMVGRVTSWGAQAERLFGRSSDDALGARLDVLFPGHFCHEVAAVVATVLAGERIRHFESEVVRPDGLPLPVSVSLRPVNETGDIPIGMVVIVRDVTEQRLAQATLAELDARLEQGEAMAHVGSWLWDLRTGAVQWSAEFHRIHGVDPLEFDGTFDSYLARVHPGDRERLRAAMVDSVDSGRSFDDGYRVVHPDGALHMVQVRAQPTFGSAGTAVGLRGIGQDVTARDRLAADQVPRSS